MITIALADDHTLLRNGLAALITSIGFEVLFEAGNGEECIDKIKKIGKPDIILMDINMPVKDGFETTLFIKHNYPEIKILALTMVDDEEAVIKMIRNGARGYLLKETGPAELKAAIHAVMVNGFYYSEMVTGRLVHNIAGENEGQKNGAKTHLTDKEIEFLKLACSELTYKEIADKMKVSPRTIDSYRDHLFEKLELKTRTGLALYAIKSGIVKL